MQQLQRFGSGGWIPNSMDVLFLLSGLGLGFSFCFLLITPVHLLHHLPARFHAAGAGPTTPVSHPVKQIKLYWWGCSWVWSHTSNGLAACIAI
jgi:hypothetical protein